MLTGFIRGMYSILKKDVDWPSFRQYYRWGQGLRAEDQLLDMAPIIASAECPDDRANRARL